MGKSIIVPGGDFKSLRVGIIGGLIPQKLTGLTNLWIAPKFINGELLNVVSENDLSTPENEFNYTYNPPVLNQESDVFIGKKILRFTRTSTREGSYVRGILAHNDWTITICFNSIANSGGQTLFSLNNDTEYMRYMTRKSDGFAGLNTSALPDPINLSPYESGEKEVVSAAKKGSTILVVKNGLEIFNETINFQNPMDTISIGGYDGTVQESSLTPFNGEVAYISTYNLSLSLTEIQALHAQLGSYY